jgi:rod shape-determining protein MreC
VTETRAFFLRTAAVWLLLELVAASQVVGPDGSPVLWQWVRVATRPVAVTAEHIGVFVSDLAFGLRDTRRLLAENLRLRYELEDAQSRNLLLAEDLAALQETARLVGGVDGFEASSVAARCVYSSLTLGRMEVRIATPHVVPFDTPVVSSTGLVGRVVRSNRRSCWIETLTHPAAAVAVKTESGTVQGLVAGTGKRELLVEYVSRTAELLRGELLVTSGADGIYPPGIPVAKVSRIRESDAAFLEVMATPAVDTNRVRVVLLLPGWTPDRARSRPR